MVQGLGFGGQKGFSSLGSFSQCSHRDFHDRTFAGMVVLDTNGGTLNFVALYISSIVESLNFLGPGC